MRGLYELFIFIVTSCVVVSIYNKRNFKLFRVEVWKHPIRESGKFIVYVFKILAIIWIMYYFLGLS